MAVKDDEDAVRAEIERRAYLRYCERGCTPGGELDDWLAAEREVRTTIGSQEREPDAGAKDDAPPAARHSPRGRMRRRDM